MSNYNFFYNFHTKPLAYDLFDRIQEVGQPLPPPSNERITEDGTQRITEDGQIRVTE